jgi:hypothetical protein
MWLVETKSAQLQVEAGTSTTACLIVVGSNLKHKPIPATAQSRAVRRERPLHIMC